jgi:hypothetical protein
LAPLFFGAAKMKVVLSYIAAALVLGWAGATLLEGGVKSIEKSASAQAEAFKRAGLQ